MGRHLNKCHRWNDLLSIAGERTGIMKQDVMSIDVMEYIVWLIEIIATEFFNGNKVAAYEALTNSGLYHIYLNSYETTHTLGREYLIEEIREYFIANGVDIAC